jgi:pyridoxine/pyridoxamine 5'-phosphate oxidase
MGVIGDDSEFFDQQRFQLHDRVTARRSDEVVFDIIVYANVPK